MYCLDTNVIVNFLRGDNFIIGKVKELVEAGDIYITPITLCELFKGVYLSSKSKKELEILEGFILSVSLLDFDKESCEEFGKMYVILKKIGKVTNEFDLMIACVAKKNNLTLVTQDKKHFKDMNVKVEVW